MLLLIVAQAALFSIDFFIELEVHQLVEMIEICLALGPSEPLVNGQQVPIMLHYAREFIAILSNAFPNQKDVLYMAAMIKYLHREIQPALNLINRCLQRDKDFISAHILMAKISIYDRNYKTAHNCLENALILDFQVPFRFKHMSTQHFCCTFRFGKICPTFWQRRPFLNTRRNMTRL